MESMGSRKPCKRRSFTPEFMERRAVVEYIGWYNGSRLHSTFGYRSPAEYAEQNKITRM